MRRTHTYSDPTVLWRLTHPNGGAARVTLIPGHPTSTLVWFVDETLDRAENFADWNAAIARAEETRRLMLEDGWRDAEDLDKSR